MEEKDSIKAEPAGEKTAAADMPEAGAVKAGEVKGGADKGGEVKGGADKGGEVKGGAGKASADNEKTDGAADKGENADGSADESVPIVFDEDFDANSDEYIAMLESKGNNIASNVKEQPRYERPRLSFKEWIADFWYRHKSKVLIIGVILAMGSYIFVHSIPDKYDYTFMIFSSNYYFDDYAMQEIAHNLEQYGEDLDGDGQVKVHTMRYDCNSSDYNELMVSRVFMAEEYRKHHEGYLVLTDRAHYQALVDDEDGFGDGLFEHYKGMDNWIDVTDCGLFAQVDGAFSTNDVDKKLGLSLVALNDETGADEVLVKRHDDAVAMLDRILEDHPEIGGK